MSDPSLCFETATTLAALLRNGDVSARELVQIHLDRIEAVNPGLNAIVTLVPERALDWADEADARRGRGEPLGPLHGLPIAHKDLVMTAGIRSTLGCRAFATHVPRHDDLIVTRLRAAGAITIGKTNTPELGAGSQTFNEVFGATANPWDPQKTCGGSSGGAAAALASRMIPIADGSDMGGSLRNPANFCNVFGFRPSLGRVPAYPVARVWSGLSVLGPMARTAADTALLLSAMAGPDDRDPTSLATPGEAFRRPLGRSWRGVRIGWSATGGGLPVDPRVRFALESGRRVLSDLGCEVVDVEPDWEDADEAFQTLRALAFAHQASLLPAGTESLLKDTVRWNIARGRALAGLDVARAEALRTAIYQRFRQLLQDRELAFLAMPVNQVPPFDLEIPYPTEIDGVAMETYVDWMKSAWSVTLTGHPAISVPCSFTPDGLPVGLQLVGRHQDDFGVLQLAYAFDEATGLSTRCPPPPTSHPGDGPGAA